MERDDLRSGIAPYLDQETSERKAIYDRLVGIEREMKKRGSRRFTRYLIAILIGVAATLAWQSYGESAKQIIATRAPELGWSPETKQMIATSIQWIGWTKPSAGPEKQVPSVTQTAKSSGHGKTCAPKTLVNSLSMVIYPQLFETTRGHGKTWEEGFNLPIFFPKRGIGHEVYSSLS